MLKKLVRLGYFLQNVFGLTKTILFVSMIFVIFLLICGLQGSAGYIIAFGLGSGTIGISYELGRLLVNLDEFTSNSD